MLILAGLGNPGPKYERNRHNIGFLCVDEMASRWRFGPWRTKFQSEVCEGNIQTPAGEVRALLMKPQTYMNESGRAILAAAKFYKTPLDQVVVFHDEMDLAPGRFRMKTGGGAAGHNGLRSIIGQMGPNFRRARMGVGHPGDKDMVLGWVLSDFNKVDGPWVEGDRELYVAAGMQLWGENRITLEPTLTDEYGITKLAEVKPTVLALYGKDMNAINTFWASIPKANDPSAPICYDYPWPADASSDFPTMQGHTCLTKLQW